MKRGQAKVDRIGQEYNGHKILEYIGNKNGSVYKFECMNCGSIKDAKLTNIVRLKFQFCTACNPRPLVHTKRKAKKTNDIDWMVRLRA